MHFFIEFISLEHFCQKLSKSVDVYQSYTVFDLFSSLACQIVGWKA